jgi:hypothetical protein
MTLLWACTNLSTLPDPTKPVWEQDAKVLEILMYTEEKLREEAMKGIKE